MVMSINYLIATLIVVLMIGFPNTLVFAEGATASLIITEVKVRHDTKSTTDPDEYIELYNAGSVAVSLDDYVLEYFNASAVSNASAIPVIINLPSGLFEPGAHVVLAKDITQIPDSYQSPQASLTDDGGRLRLVDNEGTIVDEIGWANSVGSATAPGVYPVILYMCNNTAVSCITKLQSLGRVLVDEQYMTTGLQWQLGAPSPLSESLTGLNSPNDGSDLDDNEVNNEEEVTEDIEGDTQNLGPDCAGVLFSEVLPNPAGSDTGREYIELYNPTATPIDLTGCGLQTSANAKVYIFETVIIEPQQIKVLFTDITGLTLPNAAGGSVWLLEDGVEVATVDYEANLDDDVAWALQDGTWQLTYEPTPGLSNLILSEKPCEAGYVRDEVTRDCDRVAVKVAAVTTLTPCRSDQSRNPATNRCRSLAAAPMLTPCRSDQERNPETNRCRTAQQAATLSPCVEGEARNPETNRCRRVLSATSDALPPVSDVVAPVASNLSRLALLASAGLLVIGYGVYEWRRDISLLGGRFLRRISGVLTHK